MIMNLHFCNLIQIKDIKDDVEYYIENCQEDDFTENEMVYDDIDGLEEMLLDLSNVSLFSLLNYYCLGHKQLKTFNIFNDQ